TTDRIGTQELIINTRQPKNAAMFTTGSSAAASAMVTTISPINLHAGLIDRMQLASFQTQHHIGDVPCHHLVMRGEKKRHVSFTDDTQQSVHDRHRMGIILRIRRLIAHKNLATIGQKRSDTESALLPLTQG